MVNRLTLSDPKEYDHICEGCTLGKSHRLPFPKFSETKYEWMGLLAVDLTGPMAIASWSGMFYALIVIEASSRYTMCHLMEMKREVAAALKEVITLLEWQSGMKTKKICTNNGSEFVNPTIDEL